MSQQPHAMIIPESDLAAALEAHNISSRDYEVWAKARPDTRPRYPSYDSRINTVFEAEGWPLPS